MNLSTKAALQVEVRRLVDEEVKTTFSEIELIPDADDSILP
jgi:hypothetical protein